VLLFNVILVFKCVSVMLKFCRVTIVVNSSACETSRLYVVHVAVAN